MTKMAAPKLETVVGSLLTCVKQIETATARTSAELTTESRTNKDLRNQWFYTANFGLYVVLGGEPTLYFGGRDANPIFNNIEEASKQLIEIGNYVVPAADLEAVFASTELGAAIKVPLSDLDLTKQDNEFSYFVIDPTHTKSLTPAQRKLGQAVYGKENDFGKNMKMFAKAQLKPRIYVLNPEYVKQNANNDGIARACWLDGYSYFDASGRVVDGSDDALRGVRMIGEADARKIAPVEGKVPTMHQLLTASRKYVSEIAWPQFEEQIRKLYK